MSGLFTYSAKKALRHSEYHVLGIVGQGQFGRVFCAIHRSTGQLVALKELERQSTHKFLRELRFLLSLAHPNIITFQALEYTQTKRYLVMDYCEGGTLRSLIQSKIQLSLAERLKLITDVLAGLGHAHSRGIIHRDIKPENILLNLHTTGWIARISDFGIARLSQELYGCALDDIGSSAYMAPERFYGEYSPASDLYAVGILLFELMVGHRPFSGTPKDLMLAHLNQLIKVPDTIPFLLRSTILTALQKLPARRFTSAAQMLRSIQLAAEVYGLAQEAIPLAKPAVSLSVCPSVTTQQEPLRVLVTSLVVESQQVYQAYGSQIFCQTYTSDALAKDALHQWQIQLNAPVQTLIPRPQGCFAVTQKRLHNCFVYSIYCLPRTYCPTFGKQSECSLEQYRLLSFECINSAIAIAPQGQWIAIAKTVAPRLLEQTTFQILKLPSLQPIKPPQNCRFPLQLIPLDSRYGIVVSTQLENEVAGSAGTVFEVFSRRGSFVGVLNLPISLRLVTLSATFPYRLLAIDQNNPSSALLIDLKPFRVFRIELEISPAFVVATYWGYVIADRQGKIVLLDRDGKNIGSFRVPATPSAIATFEDYGLLIATWSGDRGTLDKVDLRQLHRD
ncbi:serine/threonine-protein kinase [Gloeocapsopsis dulcis]|uniref:Protein kinase domain-containing protein n=1 Tax=Gloeocapsopsis dulcis AAB1 = 1H9 TaxID=1433147 RepID=A0A6N8FUR2_9CHRO|nr:serine/threonine-protein kinase [Gloeocapsopsis dulcis]MUL36858.1 hypothetical protein [Gloeocapsopsis dulcis AAB1 = 1H9]WNN88534.1 serine/threonine-protein kinase [Gloeocapsopsis dulcis]